MNTPTFAFLEGFFTIIAAAGAGGLGLQGTTFPGWWPLACAALPVLAGAVSNGIRAVNRLNTPPSAT